MSVRRTRTESNRVRKILSNTKTEFLECRTYRRHPFILPPEIILEDPQSTRKQSMTLVYYCPQCTTKRLDVFEVKIDKEDNLDLREMTARQYIHPEGYSQSIDDPKIEPMEYMQEYLSRMVKQIRRRKQ